MKANVDSRYLLPQEIIESKIFLIRGRKAMLDRDLARLYGVDVKHLKGLPKK
jgi:hypothetical protein